MGSYAFSHRNRCRVFFRQSLGQSNLLLDSKQDSPSAGSPLIKADSTEEIKLPDITEKVERFTVVKGC
ncbi:uncharacterized protein METZ01_LOCUS230557 [marine metagenome]|uniref:Uncharacterized protein n=1 Tax=marine metagenome TaxID=408172 RepID=A0A382GT07_9ZZZZ